MTDTEDPRPSYGIGELPPDNFRDEPAAGTALRSVAADTTPAQRTLPGRRCVVTLDGAEPFEVRIDNRDYLRWDKTAPRQKWGSGKDVPFLMATFLAWSAASRAGLTDLKWADFEAAAVDVDNREDDDDADLARPTQ